MTQQMGNKDGYKSRLTFSTIADNASNASLPHTDSQRNKYID